MPVATPSLPPLSPRVNGAAVPPLDDVKLQFVTEEVRKRFSAITVPEMLRVLQLLVTDKRIAHCEEEGSPARVDGRSPHDEHLEQPSAAESVRKSSGTLVQQQSSMNSSATASELSPRDWGSMVWEANEAAAHNSPAAARLNREWRSAITLILDNARQFRQGENESYTAPQLVEASVAEWAKRAGATAAADRGAAEPQAAAVSPARRPLMKEAWLSAIAKARRLAEDACCEKYDAQYTQLHSEAENDNEEGNGAATSTPHDDDSIMAPPSGLARRSTHRSLSGNGGIPPFSLVIQCSAPPPLATPQEAAATKAAAQKDGTSDDTSTCLVVGCEWFQWVFLVQCPVACQSEPYPVLDGNATAAEAAAIRQAQRRWRRRHCTVQLLYPSEAGFSASPDSGSDLRSADAEYELSEPQVVLSSLLGVAMRVWCQSHPHLVAEVFQLEEDTYPQHLYDGTSFWSLWPIRDLGTWQQCESAGSSDSMPIPLLPGECFAHDSDLDEEEESSENAD